MSVKFLSVVKFEGHDRRVDIYHRFFEVINETKKYYITRADRVNNIIGMTTDDRLKGIVRWSKETLRPIPFEDTWEYYKVIQIIDFKLPSSYPII